MITGFLIVAFILVVVLSIICKKLHRFTKEQQDILTLSQYTQKALNRNVREAEQRLLLAQQKMDILENKLTKANNMEFQAKYELIQIKNFRQILDNHVSRKITKKKKTSKKRRKAA